MDNDLTPSRSPLLVPAAYTHTWIWRLRAPLVVAALLLLPLLVFLRLAYFVPRDATTRFARTQKRWEGLSFGASSAERLGMLVARTHDVSARLPLLQ